MTTVLELEDVWFAWSSDIVLRGISLTIYRGDIVVIRGRSGVGKTTLAKIAALIIQPSKGRVMFLGRDVSKISSYERDLLRLKYIGYIDQSYRLIPHLTVFDNIALSLRLLGYNTNEVIKHTKEVMSLLNIVDIGDRYPEEISGGQRQRVAIARALVKKPLLVIADEPISNLDDETANKVLKVFWEYAEKQRAGILITTTDLSTKYLCTREYILRDGLLSEVKN